LLNILKSTFVKYLFIKVIRENAGHILRAVYFLRKSCYFQDK